MGGLWKGETEGEKKRRKGKNIFSGGRGEHPTTKKKEREREKRYLRKKDKAQEN